RHVVPAAVVVFLPAVAAVAVDVAVAAGVDVAVAGPRDAGVVADAGAVARHGTAPAARRRPPRGGAGDVVGDARRRRPLIAAADRALSPAAVDARSLPRPADRAGAWVVRGRGTARAVRPPRSRAA